MINFYNDTTFNPNHNYGIHNYGTRRKQDMAEAPPTIDNIIDSQGLFKNKPPLY